VDTSSKWYFVNFPDSPNLQHLQTHGITLSSKFYISQGFFNLFLSPVQVHFLVNECNAEVSEVKDKLIYNSIPVHSADYLVIEVSESFDSSLHEDKGFQIDRVSSVTYLVKGTDMERVLSYFANLNEVYSITPIYRPALSNHLAAGYSQLNTKQLDTTNGFPRYLEEQGLNGEGVIVSVMDTPIDWFSTFFYDRENVLPGPKHRKILLSVEPEPIVNSSHGTHVAGTVAGNSSDGDASYYNGVAPAAKIIHFALFNSEDVVPVMIYLEVLYMNQYDAHISTNSWRFYGFVPSIAQLGDDTTYTCPHLFFIFCAGNEQQMDYYRLNGSLTIGSPSGSKNLVTVGALAHVPVDNSPPNPRIVGSVSCPYGQFHFFGVLLPESKNPFNDDVISMGVTEALWIWDASQWDQLFDGTKHECALTSVLGNISKPLSFPVFFFEDPDFWELIGELRVLPGPTNIRFYQEYRTGHQSLGWFSSQGPSMTGILKPDVVAPGEQIYSARSKANGIAEHDLNPLKLQLMDGTSMATPNVAGITALIQQYFRSGFHPRTIEPTARFLKGMLIHCSDPLPPDRKFPNNEYGFGQINAGRYLPFANSSFSILVNETVLIGPSQHLVSNVKISSNENPLRITISYLDPAASADSLFPLLSDLDLIVISRTGRIFRGNHYLNGSEEHFSTTERVILDAYEVEPGDYEIHVISSFSQVVQNSIFAVIMTGDISKDQSSLEFANASSCIPCDGTCDTKTFICNCQSPTSFGQSCQIKANEITVSENPVIQSFIVQPLESLYVRLRNPTGPNEFLVHVSGNTPIVLRIFVAIDSSPNGIPFTYHEVIWDNISARSDWEEKLPGSVVDLLIRNEFSKPWGFRVWGNTLPQSPVPIPGITSQSTSSPVSNVSEGLSGGTIAAIVILSVLTVAFAVAFVISICRKGDSTKQVKL
jgi:subtilisin family serine protease